MRAIKLMADYQCYPLWEASPGHVGNIDPSTLPISSDLISLLMEWARMYDKTLNLDDPARSGFESEKKKSEFKKFGNEIAEKLRMELGPEYALKTKI